MAGKYVFFWLDPARTDTIVFKMATDQLYKMLMAAYYGGLKDGAK